MTESLLARFGSLDAVLAADPSVLRQITGVKDSTIALLKLAQHLCQRLRVTPVLKPPPSKATPAPIPPGAGPHAFPSANPAPSKPAPPPAPAAFHLEFPPSPAESARPVAKDPSKRPTAGKRKLQVCNGYLLEFDQLARVLSSLKAKTSTAKVSRESLVEDTGLADRQVESLVSVGSAMGLIVPGKQTLSPAGALIAEHDTFMEMAS